MIKTENLTMVYNGNKAIDSLNLEIAEGDIFGFLGPNGAGKSTTILMLMRMIEPSEGKCIINDIEVARNPLKVKEIIGYLKIKEMRMEEPTLEDVFLSVYRR